METGPRHRSWNVLNLNSQLWTAILVCLVVTLCYLASRLGGALVLGPQMLSPLWPGCALLVSVLLLTPRRTWPILIVAAFATFAFYDLRAGVPISSIVRLLLADAVEVLTAAFCLRYFFDGVPWLNSVRALAKYSFFAVCLAPMAGAFVGAFAIGPNYWTNWKISFFSEALAFLTLVPAILGWAGSEPRGNQKTRAYYPEATALIVTLLLLGYFTFVAPENSSTPALLYSLVPLLLWSALRFGSTGVSTSMIVIACLSIRGAVHGRGPFVGSGALSSVLSLQLFLLLAAASFMVLAALVEERKQADKNLRKSEERFRLAAQAGKMFAYEWDAATNLIVRSAESAEILGIDETTELTDEQILAKVHPDDRERLVAAVGELSPEKPKLEISYRMLQPDGTVIWVERNSRAHFDEQGRMLRIVGMIADITERKRAEEELRESEEKFRSIFRDAGVGMAIVSPGGRFLAGNEAFSRFIGYTEEELLGKTVQSVTHPEDWSMFSKRLSQALADGASFQGVQKRCLHKNGQVLCGECSASLIRGPDGQAQYFIAEVLDITERKRAEEALRESEKRFRLVADTAPALIWMSGTDKMCTFFNKGWLEFTGRSMEQELGEGWVSGVHPEDLERCLRLYRDRFDARVDFEMEYRLLRFDGNYRWIVEYGVPRFESDGTFCGFIGSCVDITDRKLTSQSLQDLSGRLITSQEEERARIARELHDDFSQRLALHSIGLAQLWKKLPESKVEERAEVQELLKRTREMASDMRSLSYQLHSTRLEHVGLKLALAGLCKEMSLKYNIEIEFTQLGVSFEIPQDVALCLFRIAQEALRNVVKHSHVKQVQAELRGADNEIRLRVVDAGAGFDPGLRSTDAGIGLVSMRERLRLVGGTLSVRSAPSKGTEILAQVPLSSQMSETQRRTRAAGE
jgi:PAS domain S-box-containing protein